METTLTSSDGSNPSAIKFLRTGSTVSEVSFFATIFLYNFSSLSFDYFQPSTGESIEDISAFLAHNSTTIAPESKVIAIGESADASLASSVGVDQVVGDEVVEDEIIETTPIIIQQNNGEYKVVCG